MSSVSKHFVSCTFPAFPVCGRFLRRDFPWLSVCKKERARKAHEEKPPATYFASCASTPPSPDSREPVPPTAPRSSRATAATGWMARSV